VWQLNGILLKIFDPEWVFIFSLFNGLISKIFTKKKVSLLCPPPPPPPPPPAINNDQSLKWFFNYSFLKLTLKKFFIHRPPHAIWVFKEEFFKAKIFNFHENGTYRYFLSRHFGSAVLCSFLSYIVLVADLPDWCGLACFSQLSQ
jgi:hypothetical protein